MKSVICYALLFLMFIQSPNSWAETMLDWEVKDGVAITYSDDKDSQSHWKAILSEIILVDDSTASFRWYLIPKQTFESCEFEYNGSDEPKRTAVVVNGEVIGAYALCEQHESGTSYVIVSDSGLYTDRLIEIFKQSNSVKVEHDIATFTVSAKGFTKVWDAKSVNYNPPTYIDFKLSERIKAKRGDITSQLFLGFCYVADEQTCPKDPVVAFKWNEIAAKQGNPDGQMMIARMYESGEGVTQSIREAVKWYKKSAGQGQAKSQFQLSLLYAKGEGVIEDAVTAHMWANLSASNGNQDAIRLRELIKDMLSQNELEEANRMARECISSDYKACGH